VQAAGASLPELDRVGLKRIPPPERRARHVLPLEPPLVLGDGFVERFPAVDHAALTRRPGADLAAARAAREVGVRELVGQRLDQAAHSQLAVQLHPRQRERAVRVGSQCAPLRRLAVREEPEAALVQPAQEDVAGFRPPLRIDRRQRHGVRLDALGRDCVVDPLA
jgi:hypothetical protein